MAAFSSYYEDSNTNPFLVDSVMSMKMIMSSFMEDHNCFSQFYPPETAPTAMVVTRKQSSESSTVVDKLDSGEQVTQKLTTPIHNKRNTTTGFSAHSKDGREKKCKKQKQCNGEAKVKQQKKAKAEKEESKKSGYIHVRARRGEATDSHSLAERVRREKITERMKILQKLVPGCDKVAGKALMLDEIINYVQSLQNQVEFLSMKIASVVNPMFYDFGMDQDSLIFRPSETSRPLPQPPAAAATTTVTAPSYAFSQDNVSLLWDVEEQEQKFLNPSGFNDSLCSFN